MKSFFSELKRAREAQNISLSEVSEVTLINLKMLEALESGDTGALPEAYVRAFIRGYAGAIGLDKEATIAQYDAARKPVKHVERPLTSAVVAPSRKEISSARAPEARKARSANLRRFKPVLLKISAAIIVLVLLDLALWNILTKDPLQTIQELPFREVVREQERKAGLTDSAALLNEGRSIAPLTPSGTSKDTSRGRRVTAPPSVVIDKDSLTLVALTSDSVWMQIVVDDENLTEHYLLPHTTMKWRAKDEFWISAIGNPNGIKFALNNRPITIPIRPGFVTRDVRLTRESLQTH